MGMDGGGARKPFTKWTADTERAFLMALRLCGQPKKAAAEIGRSANAAYTRRRLNAEFRAKWDAAIAEQQREWIEAHQERLAARRGEALDDAGGGRLAPGQERDGGWDKSKRGLFLRTLRRTKRVDRACEAAGVAPRAAHALRGRSPRFAAAWEKALRDGAPPSVIEAALARAVEGWDEPIVHGGQIVGQRRRYSDTLLRMLLARELAAESGGAAKAAAAAAPAAEAAAVRPAKRRAGKRELQRLANEAAKAAGGAFILVAKREDTDAALLKKIEMIDKARAMEREELDEARWKRWRLGWAAAMSGRPVPPLEPSRWRPDEPREGI